MNGGKCVREGINRIQWFLAAAYLPELESIEVFFEPSLRQIPVRVWLDAAIACMLGLEAHPHPQMSTNDLRTFSELAQVKPDLTALPVFGIRDAADPDDAASILLPESDGSFLCPGWEAQQAEQ